MGGNVLRVDAVLVRSPTLLVPMLSAKHVFEQSTPTVDSRCHRHETFQVAAHWVLHICPVSPTSASMLSAAVSRAGLTYLPVWDCESFEI